MSNIFVGLMSGTSLDGIDSVAVVFNDNKPKLLASHTHPLPQKLREDILKLCNTTHPTSTDLFSKTDDALGELFTDATLTLLDHAKLSPKQITAIGSHGQTIQHRPDLKFTIQIGNPSIIANKTGITTIANFRQNDINNGGQGAPLAPAFHQAFFSSTKRNRMIINIGGIANVTLLPANQPDKTIGFDTGPGNRLIDDWCQKIKNQSFDTNGEWARSGKVSTTLLNKLLKDSYFALPHPKSTGREYFNLAWLENYINESFSDNDIQSTVTELTAITIFEALKPFINDETWEIFLCGGGAQNRFLVERITFYFAPHTVHSTDELGVSADNLEAIGFAWLAKQRLENKMIDLRNITGSHTPLLLGDIYP